MEFAVLARHLLSFIRLFAWCLVRHLSLSTVWHSLASLRALSDDALVPCRCCWCWYCWWQGRGKPKPRRKLNVRRNSWYLCACARRLRSYSLERWYPTGSALMRLYQALNGVRYLHWDRAHLSNCKHSNSRALAHAHRWTHNQNWGTTLDPWYNEPCHITELQRCLERRRGWMAALSCSHECFTQCWSVVRRTLRGSLGTCVCDRRYLVLLLVNSWSSGARDLWPFAFQYTWQ